MMNPSSGSPSTNRLYQEKDVGGRTTNRGIAQATSGLKGFFSRNVSYPLRGDSTSEKLNRASTLNFIERHYQGQEDSNTNKKAFMNIKANWFNWFSDEDIDKYLKDIIEKKDSAVTTAVPAENFSPEEAPGARKLSTEATAAAVPETSAGITTVTGTARVTNAVALGTPPTNSQDQASLPPPTAQQPPQLQTAATTKSEIHNAAKVDNEGQMTEAASSKSGTAPDNQATANVRTTSVSSAQTHDEADTKAGIETKQTDDQPHLVPNQQQQDATVSQENDGEQEEAASPGEEPPTTAEPASTVDRAATEASTSIDPLFRQTDGTGTAELLSTILGEDPSSLETSPSLGAPTEDPSPALMDPVLQEAVQALQQQSSSNEANLQTTLSTLGKLGTLTISPTTSQRDLEAHAEENRKEIETTVREFIQAAFPGIFFTSIQEAQAKGNQALVPKDQKALKELVVMTQAAKSMILQLETAHTGALESLEKAKNGPFLTFAQALRDAKDNPEKIRLLFNKNKSFLGLSKDVSENKANAIKNLLEGNFLSDESEPGIVSQEAPGMLNDIMKNVRRALRDGSAPQTESPEIVKIKGEIDAAIEEFVPMLDHQVSGLKQRIENSLTELSFNATQSSHPSPSFRPDLFATYNDPDVQLTETIQKVEFQLKELHAEITLLMDSVDVLPLSDEKAVLFGGLRKLHSQIESKANEILAPLNEKAKVLGFIKQISEAEEELDGLLEELDRQVQQAVQQPSPGMKDDIFAPPTTPSDEIRGMREIQKRKAATTIDAKEKAFREKVKRLLGEAHELPPEQLGEEQFRRLERLQRETASGISRIRSSLGETINVDNLLGDFMDKMTDEEVRERIARRFNTGEDSPLASETTSTPAAAPLVPSTGRGDLEAKTAKLKEQIDPLENEIESQFQQFDYSLETLIKNLIVSQDDATQPYSKALQDLAQTEQLLKDKIQTLHKEMGALSNPSSNQNHEVEQMKQTLSMNEQKINEKVNKIRQYLEQSKNNLLFE